MIARIPRGIQDRAEEWRERDRTRHTEARRRAVEEATRVLEAFSR